MMMLMLTIFAVNSGVLIGDVDSENENVDQEFFIDKNGISFFNFENLMNVCNGNPCDGGS
jgi:hypothetical protein